MSFLINLYTFQYFFLKLNLLVLFMSVFITMVVFYFSKIFFFQNLLKFKSCLKFIKLYIVVSLLISFFFFLMYSYTYLLYLSNLNFRLLDDSYLCVPVYNFYFFDASVDIFGLVILFLAYFIGIISLMALDTRLYFKNVKYLFFVNIFILIVFFFCIFK